MNARIDTLHATAPTTPLPLSAEQQIGQIAVQLPGATAVFRRLKLDFCCGGQVSLAKAAADKGLDADAVLAELSALQRPSSLPDARISNTRPLPGTAFVQRAVQARAALSSWHGDAPGRQSASQGTQGVQCRQHRTSKNLTSSRGSNRMTSLKPGSAASCGSTITPPSSAMCCTRPLMFFRSPAEKSMARAVVWSQPGNAQRKSEPKNAGLCHDRCCA